GLTYHRLIQLPRGGPHRLIQPPRRGPHRLIQPPRRGPHRLIQMPAWACGADLNQAPPNTAAAIAATDHFPRPRRNRRLSCPSFSSSDPSVSKDASSFMTIEGIFYDSPVVRSESVEKCKLVISHFPPSFEATNDMLTGKEKSSPPFFPLTFPEVSIQAQP